ncbi:hypothetical protein CLAFUW4_08720 [Fulvia fulva]|uniref:BZIP domain-containing protein n=1 Tax=Passalora fulva TaxID=5499 RepID=A0A9Q8PH29_PASFU|nr:uncharacterized protein CLAFUR5_08818 [Fulvia fulva]KAK4613748.1 hypothetical protein CLAFUR4_08725 [Fulvia fulva]KAK4614320.1 hypothetical protein CLAFUR0_08721 [Fulvia fulva]UJO22294.1 hypothetical protein CLAFUR5_08818 [Fulvia fulva]WPV20506.1 hypothetical protein CLAFUW4_08720 [Fulvia fulva]WPV35055.1 hypothetical protein CLAFUW7_08720 [Fulvia fulva]
MNTSQWTTSPANMNDNASPPRTVQPETACFTTDAEVYWPEWQCYYDEGLDAQTASSMMCATNERQPEPQSQWPTQSNPPSASRSPVEVATASPSPTFSMNGKSPGESAPDGRVLKRKAQNRAAQRAHRERQRVRVSGLHDKIERLQDRCKQLQARNQMFEALFQRFFRDGVSLLGSRNSTEPLELTFDDTSSDDEGDEPDCRVNKASTDPDSQRRRRKPEIGSSASI